MGEDNDRGAARQARHIFLEPIELLSSDHSQSAFRHIDDINQANEMDAFVVKTIPAGTLCALAESLQILFAIVIENIVLARNIKYFERYGKGTQGSGWYSFDH